MSDLLNKNAKSRIGEKYINCQGYEMEIIDSFGTNNCTIRFNDEFKTVMYNQRYGAIKKGSIRNRNHRLLFNKGYIGYGDYDEIRGYKYYSTWRSMFLRCYDEKSLEKHPTYNGCEVSDKWDSLQTYAKWFDENYIEGWQLDKDILVKGNKIYSPETCVFVPREVNIVLIIKQRGRSEYPMGVRKRGDKFEARIVFNKKEMPLGSYDTVEEAFDAFKNAKEKHVKEVADKWKDQLDPRVYQIMYNYEIKITD